MKTKADQKTAKSAKRADALKENLQKRKQQERDRGQADDKTNKER